MGRTQALLVSCLPVLGFAAGAWAQDYRIKHTPKTDAEYREDAAITMLRLGVMKWVGACHYAAAVDRVPISSAKKMCTVDLLRATPSPNQAVSG